MSTSVCRAIKEETFFWTSMINRACISCRRRRSFSRVSAAVRWAWAIAGSALFPRLRGSSPALPSAARRLRHAARLDE